jgi:hypothetical protein
VVSNLKYARRLRQREGIFQIHHTSAGTHDRRQASTSPTANAVDS